MPPPASTSREDWMEEADDDLPPDLVDYPESDAYPAMGMTSATMGMGTHDNRDWENNDWAQRQNQNDWRMHAPSMTYTFATDMTPIQSSIQSSPTNSFHLSPPTPHLSPDSTNSPTSFASTPPSPQDPSSRSSGSPMSPSTSTSTSFATSTFGIGATSTMNVGATGMGATDDSRSRMVMDSQPHASPESFHSFESTSIPSPSSGILPPPSIRTSHTRARDASYIPRPPNAFILFRSSFIRSQKISGKVEGNHSTLSKIIGMYWRALPPSDRAEWEAKAVVAQAEHRKRYPDWRFRPGANALLKEKGRVKDRDRDKKGKAKVKEVKAKGASRAKLKVKDGGGGGSSGQDVTADVDEGRAGDAERGEDAGVGTVGMRTRAGMTTRAISKGKGKEQLVSLPLAAASRKASGKSRVIEPDTSSTHPPTSSSSVTTSTSAPSSTSAPTSISSASTAKDKGKQRAVATSAAPAMRTDLSSNTFPSTPPNVSSFPSSSSSSKDSKARLLKITSLLVEGKGGRELERAVEAWEVNERDDKLESEKEGKGRKGLRSRSKALHDVEEENAEGEMEVDEEVLQLHLQLDTDADDAEQVRELEEDEDDDENEDLQRAIHLSRLDSLAAIRTSSSSASGEASTSSLPPLPASSPSDVDLDADADLEYVDAEYAFDFDAVENADNVDGEADAEGDTDEEDNDGIIQVSRVLRGRAHVAGLPRRSSSSAHPVIGNEAEDEREGRRSESITPTRTGAPSSSTTHVQGVENVPLTHMFKRSLSAPAHSRTAYSYPPISPDDGAPETDDHATRGHQGFAPLKPMHEDLSESDPQEIQPYFQFPLRPFPSRSTTSSSQSPYPPPALALPSYTYPYTPSFLPRHAQHVQAQVHDPRVRQHTYPPHQARHLHTHTRTQSHSHGHHHQHGVRFLGVPARRDTVSFPVSEPHPPSPHPAQPTPTSPSARRPLPTVATRSQRNELHRGGSRPRTLSSPAQHPTEQQATTGIRTLTWQEAEDQRRLEDAQREMELDSQEVDSGYWWSDTSPSLSPSLDAGVAEESIPGTPDSGVEDMDTREDGDFEDTDEGRRSLRPGRRLVGVQVETLAPNPFILHHHHSPMYEMPVVGTEGMGYAEHTHNNHPSSQSSQTYHPSPAPIPSDTSEVNNWTTSPGRQGLFTVIHDPYMASPHRSEMHQPQHQSQNQQTHSQSNLSLNTNVGFIDDINKNTTVVSPTSATSTRSPPLTPISPTSPQNVPASSFSSLSGWAGDLGGAAFGSSFSHSASAASSAMTMATTGTGSSDVDNRGISSISDEEAGVLEMEQARGAEIRGESDSASGDMWYRPPGWDSGLQPACLRGGLGVEEDVPEAQWGVGEQSQYRGGGGFMGGMGRGGDEFARG